MRISPDILELGTLMADRLDGVLSVYPVCADKGIPMPYAIYRRASTAGSDTKDRYVYEARAQVEVLVVAATYIESVDKAKQVKERMEGVSGRLGDLIITRCSLSNASEDWVADAYVQRLNFDITVENAI